MKRLFTRIVNGYTRNMKLTSKFLISHLVLIIIPTIVVGIVFYGVLFDIIVNDTIQQETAIAKKTSENINDDLQHIVDTSGTIEESLERVDRLSSSTFAYNSSITDIDSIYYNIMGMIDGERITDIRIYYAPSYSNLADYNKPEKHVFEPLSAVYGTYWYGIFDGQGGNELFCPQTYLSPQEVEQNGELAYIKKLSLGNAEDSEDDSLYIAVYFSQNRIDSLLSQEITITDSATFIINAREESVSTSNSTLSGTYSTISTKNLLTTVGPPGVLSTATFVNEPARIVYYELGDTDETDWYMISVIPEDNLRRKGILLVYQFFGIYVVFLFLAFIIALFLSRSITKRILRIVKQMELVRTGKPVALEEKEVSRDEIGDLLDTYNYMTNEINYLMDKQSQAAKELRLSEFKALQAQINPHFLYNTLDMINWLSLSDQKEELTQAVQTLSKFYKLTLSKRDTLTTIEQELEHVSLYVKIQNMRYDNAFHMVVDIPDDIIDCEVPKLMFQPIVENSIQHGILMKESKRGTIVITGWRENNDIVFLISDDGTGMDEHSLDNILTGNLDKEDSGTNIGVYNTHLRLQFLFGAKYGLSYQSSVGIGTEVTIRIPLKQS